MKIMPKNKDLEFNFYSNFFSQLFTHLEIVIQLEASIIYYWCISGVCVTWVLVFWFLFFGIA